MTQTRLPLPVSAIDDLREAVVQYVGCGEGPKTFCCIIDGRPEIIFAPHKQLPTAGATVTLRRITYPTGATEWQLAGGPTL